MSTGIRKTFFSSLEDDWKILWDSVEVFLKERRRVKVLTANLNDSNEMLSSQIIQ